MEVVIIGGGPIGTWTALQIKRRNPVAHVIIYERFHTYQRNHIMTVHKQSLLRSSLADERFLRGLCALQTTCSAVCKPKAQRGKRFRLPSKIDIRTTDFEDFMKQECESAGIKFVYERVASPEDAMDAHPDCDLFIAADGANSKTRSSIFGEDCLSHEKLFPSLDFNYKAVGQTEYMLNSTFSDIAHLGLEYIGTERNGLSDVNLRFIISEKNYNKVPSATFKEPLVVDDASPFWNEFDGEYLFSGRKFKDDFDSFLKLRREFAGEVRATDISMTKIYLARYAAKTFSKLVKYKNKQRGWFLVGDAAMGMPFFRSMNSGIILGSQLGKLISVREHCVSEKVQTYNGVGRFRVVEELAITKYFQYKVYFLQYIARPILFQVARLPFLKNIVLAPFNYIAGLRGYRFP